MIIQTKLFRAETAQITHNGMPTWRATLEIGNDRYGAIASTEVGALKMLSSDIAGNIDQLALAQQRLMNEIASQVKKGGQR